MAGSDPMLHQPLPQSADAVSADDPLPRYATRRALWDARHAISAGTILCFCSMMPFASIPDLQDDTYGNNAFLIVGVTSGFQGVYNFFLSPAIGGASDTFGRGRITTAVMVALAVPYALDIAFGHFVLLFSLIFLTLFHALMGVSTAQVSDVLPQHCRTVDHPTVFGALLVSQALSGMFGSMLGAFLPWSYLRLVAIGAILSSAAALYFIYPKDSQPSQELLDCEARANDILAARAERDRLLAGRSLPDGDKATLIGDDDESLSPHYDAVVNEDDRSDGTTESIYVGVDVEKCSHLKRSLRILRRNVQLRLLVFISILNGMAEQSLAVLMPLYSEKTLGYTKVDLMVFLVGMIASKIFAAFVFAPFLSRRFSPLIALRCAIAVNILFVTALVGLQKDQPWMGWIVVTVLGAGAMAVYPLVAMFAADSVRTEGADVGLAQGTVSGARAMAEGLSPALIGGLFHFSEHSALPGAPLFVGTVSVTCALALTWRLRGVQHRKAE